MLKVNLVVTFTLSEPNIYICRAYWKYIDIDNFKTYFVNSTNGGNKIQLFFMKIIHVVKFNTKNINPHNIVHHRAVLLVLVS